VAGDDASSPKATPERVQSDDAGGPDLDSQLNALASDLDFDLDDDEFSDLANADDDDYDEDTGVKRAPVDPASVHAEPVAGPGVVEPELGGSVDEEVEELEELDFEELDSIAELQIDEVHDSPGAQDAPAAQDMTEPLKVEAPAAPPVLYLRLDGVVSAVDQERFVIGRVSKSCDLVIVDANVSRQHCAIERRGDGYYIVDMGSTNGIELDGVRIDNHRIAEGNILVLSGHRVSATFIEPDEPDEPDEPALERITEVPTQRPADLPGVTGRMPVVAAAPAAVADGVELAALASEPLPPMEPRSEAVPQADAPQSETPGGQAGYVQPGEAQVPAGVVQAAYKPTPFEQHVSEHLVALGQQVAYLQQSVDVALAQLEKLQSVVKLATVIQERLAASRQQNS